MKLSRPALMAGVTIFASHLGAQTILWDFEETDGQVLFPLAASADGSRFGGYVELYEDEAFLSLQAAVWNPTGEVILLPPVSEGDPSGSLVRDLSADGLVAVGEMSDASTAFVAYTWDEGAGSFSLGGLPGASSQSFFLSSAAGVSASGMTIAGESLNANGTLVAFLDQGAGLESLGFASGYEASAVIGIDDAGEQLALLLENAANSTVAFYDVNTRQVGPVATIPEGYEGLFGAAINAFGTVIGGYAYPDTDERRAMVMDAEGRVTLLPMPDGWEESEVYGLNAAGTIATGVVSRVGGDFEIERRGFTWRSETGLTLLEDDLRSGLEVDRSQLAPVEVRLTDDGLNLYGILEIQGIDGGKRLGFTAPYGFAYERFFPGLVDYGTVVGVDWLGFFGVEGFPWIYHLEHGWLYLLGDGRTSVWVWDGALGWWWTSPNLFPFLWQFREASEGGPRWVYYFPETTEPRFFEDLSNGGTFSAPGNF